MKGMRMPPARGRAYLPALLGGLLLATAAGGVSLGVPGRVAGILGAADMPASSLAAAAASGAATSTDAAGVGGGTTGSPSKLGINVPLELSRPLSGQSAVFAQDIRAHSLSIAGSATFGSPFSSTGAATIDGMLDARGGITTSGADINLESGTLFASNVLNGITAGDNVVITGPANHPVISVVIPQQQQQAPIFYGGGGGGGGISSVAAGSGLSGGTITESGTLSLDLGSANAWSALQSFGAGASTTDLSISGGATTSALAITDATSTLLKTGADGSVIPAIAGLDYALPGGGSALDWLVAGGALAPTSTVGILVSASSTIGDGTQAGGLTIFGGATTTGSAYIGGDMAAAGALSITGTTTLASIASGLVKSIGGVLSRAVAGTDYVATSTLGGYLSLPDWYATTTDALAEGTVNKYYADARVRTYLDSLDKGYFFSTTSAAYFLGAHQGLAFSTTSADYLLSTKGYSTFGYLFPGNATTTGLGLYASSTIGNGSQAGGLTILGGATTTGNAYFGAAVSFANALGIASGGTGTSTAPTYGKLLLGNTLGGYDLVATSSLGFVTPPWTTNGSTISYTAGNVGVGTTSPFAKFSVAGDGYFTGNLRASGTLEAGLSSASSTWTDRIASGSRGWFNVVSSSDGTKLAATARGGDIYTSTDSGATWTDQTASGSHLWRGLASSADGVKLSAAIQNGDIYTSTDSGATWTDRTGAGSRLWYAITSSSDGTKLAATVSGGDIYTSTDSGATWTDQTTAGSRSWQAVTSSADGTKLAAVVSNGDIWTSANGGATWTDQTTAGSRSWSAITSSSDGTRLAAVVDGGDIYTSIDSGVTWADQTAAGNLGWYAIASSVDGTRLVAAAYSGDIHTYTEAGMRDPALYVDSSSLRVGIGTTSPFAALGVEGAGYFHGDLTAAGALSIGDLSSFLGGFASYASSTIGNGMQAGGLTVNGNATTTGSLIVSGAATSTFAGSIDLTGGCFAIDGTCISSTPWAANGTAISYAAGNVGIGTTSPFSALSVAGNTFLGGTLTATGAVSFANALGVSSGGTGISAAPTYGKLLLGNTSGGYDLVATSSLGFVTPPWTTNGSTISYTAGNVGVGTTSPFAKFSVAGDGYFTGGLTATGAVTAGQWQTTVPGYFGAATWSQRTGAGSRVWHGIASSADGMKLAAAAYNYDYILTSTDGGATWTTTTAHDYWRGITSSSDGTKLAAVADSRIYTSVDGGTTWTLRANAPQEPSAFWYGITSSSDGTKLAAVAYNGDIYTSADSGATWIDRTAPGSRNWYAVTSSSDGTKLAAVVSGGDIWTSTDSGVTWTDQTGSGSKDWRSIASSADGTKLAAAVYNGDVYTSADGGVTWTDRTAAGHRNWTGITSSSDGAVLAAAASSASFLYISADGGATWVAQGPPGQANWQTITSSSDGSRVAAAIAGGYVWTYNAPYTPAVITPHTALTVASTTHAVGIGTTSPLALLSVQNSYGDSFADLFAVASSTSLDGSSSTPMFIITSAGNVGIGTAAPQYPLDVNGDVNISAGSAYRYAGSSIFAASTTLGSYFLAGAGSQAVTGTYNLGIGPSALSSVTSGVQNIAIGYESLASSTTGSNSIAIGKLALGKSTNGGVDIAIGTLALGQNTSGTYNTAIGGNTLQLNTTGGYNTAIGSSALTSNVTGNNNIGIGLNVLSHNASATSSVAIGNNAAMGQAEYDNQGGVYLGYESGYKASTGSDYNTLVGYQAGYDITTGADNIVIGSEQSTGSGITTGTNNIMIGTGVTSGLSQTGSNQLNIGNLIFATNMTTGSTLSGGSVGIGIATPGTFRLSVAGSIGPSGSNAYNLGASGYNWGCLYYDGGTLGTCASDERLKTGIAALDFDQGSTTALEQLAALQPRTFAYKTATSTIYHGLIAQEVLAAAPELVATDTSTGMMEVRYGDVQWLMLQAIQELIAKVNDLAQAIAGFARAFVSDKLTATNELCVGETCVTPAQFQAMVTAASQSGSAPADPGLAQADTMPPTLTLLGANPAHVTIGATYNDLGATAKDAAGHDLGVRLTLDGIAVQAIVIDTSTSSTHVIGYAATDTYGLVASTTRTVIVGDGSGSATTTSMTEEEDTAPVTEEATSTEDSAAGTDTGSASTTPEAGDTALVGISSSSSTPAQDQ